MSKVIEKIKRVYKKRKPKELLQEHDSKKESDKPTLPPSSVILGIQ